jgi:hypothetical protein
MYTINTKKPGYFRHFIIAILDMKLGNYYGLGLPVYTPIKLAPLPFHPDILQTALSLVDAHAHGSARAIRQIVFADIPGKPVGFPLACSLQMDRTVLQVR